MATAAEKSDRDAVLQALAERRKVEPEVRRRIAERAAKLRRETDRNFSEELSVQLIREIRDE